MRVVGLQHEFSPIPNAREDMTSLMLNVKQIRFRMEGMESGRAHLRLRGPAEVTAGDLETPAGLEVINPEQHLVTLDSAEGEFEMELTVAAGKGYSPSEDRGALPIGEIPTDAIFSPIRRVNFTLERERVGPTTDFDRLVVDIWTDGTISPEKALGEAARMLVEHFQLITTAEAIEVSVGEEQPAQAAEALATSFDTAIEALSLNVRAYNCLKRAGISTIGQVLAKLVTNENELLEIRNFGHKSLAELKEKLTGKGLYPPPDGFRPEEILKQGSDTELGALVEGSPAGMES
jgi:DNA-directed RNA polymerase subunit alpha